MMEELIDNYIEELNSLEEFKRLKELKIIIDEKYKKEIFNFKMNEDKYLEALKYPNQYDIDSLRLKLSNSKAILYSKDEVIEYLKLERFIQEKLDLDFNNIKSAISKKYNTDSIFHKCMKIK